RASTGSSPPTSATWLPRSGVPRSRPSRRPRRRPPPPLLDEREHLEHRQVHRDHDDTDHHADQDQHQGLDDRRQPLNGRVDLVLETQAIVSLTMPCPIFIGILSLIRSQCVRPGSVFVYLRMPKNAAASAGKMM